MVTPGPAALGRSRADFQPGKLVLSSPFLSIDVPWHAKRPPRGEQNWYLTTGLTRKYPEMP